MPTTHRFTFHAEFPFGKLGDAFVQIAAPPSMEDGRQEIAITYPDSKEATNVRLYEILAKFYDETGFNENDAALLFGIGHLTHWLPQNKTEFLSVPDDGATIWEAMEVWKLYKLYPKQINLGELIYTGSDQVHTEVTWSYEGIEYLPVTIQLQ